MSCEFGFDPFDVESTESFHDHLGACIHCAQARSVLQAARQTWRDMNARDDANRAPFRERRLVRGRSRGAAWRVAPILAFAVGVLVTLLVTRRLLPPTPTEHIAIVAPAPSPIAPSAPPVASGVREEASSLVVVAHRGVSFVGRPLSGTSEAVFDVPRGGHLTLGFAVGAPLVDVDGPSSIRTDGSTLVLDGGALDVADTSSLVVRTSHARMHFDHARCRVTADGKETRITRKTGVVTVDALADAHQSRVVSEGTSIVVGAGGVVTTEDATSLVRKNSNGGAAFAWDAAFQDALSRLERGERDGAEAAFRHVADAKDAPSKLRSRARFRAGELALGRHDRATGTAMLDPLIQDADPALASDAALLLARSLDTQTERAAVWNRLLSRELPEPYRAHALRERHKPF